MQGNDAANSLHAVATRITALSANGAPASGNLMYVTDSLVKLDFNPTMEAGTETTQKNAAGRICFNFKQPDVMKRLAISIQVCSPDPELEAILSGGTLYVSGGTPGVLQGYQYPALLQDPVPNGVSIEIWTHAVVGEDVAPTNPYMHWVFPKVKRIVKTNRTIDENAVASAFNGDGLENTNWGVGPVAASPFPYDASKVAQWVRTATFPVPQIGSLVAG